MTIRRPLLAMALLSSAAFADSSKTFHLTNVPNTAALNEIATIFRTVAGIKQIHADVATHEISVTGTDDELALAAWLVKQLDTSTPGATTGSYTTPDGGDSVRIYYIAHAPQQALLNEMVTTLRTVADVQRIFTYSPMNAIVLRSGVTRVTLTDWLVQQLDVAPDNQARWQPHQIPAADIPGAVAKVVYLIHPVNNMGFNSIIVSLRAIVDVQAIFSRSSPQGIAFRGTPAQVQFADWLFQQLDVEPSDEMRAQKHEYLVRNDKWPVSRVYYLASGTTTEQLNALATELRNEAGVARIMADGQIAAISLRGTQEAIDAADRIISAKRH